MPKNFYTEIDGQPVHVNRRGCKGPWSKRLEEALEALVRAARAMPLNNRTQPQISSAPDVVDAVDVSAASAHPEGT